MMNPLKQIANIHPTIHLLHLLFLLESRITAFSEALNSPHLLLKFTMKQINKKEKQ